MSAPQENSLTKSPLRTIKKAWATLPKSTKTVYKLIGFLLCIFGYMVSSNISSESISSVESKVSLPSSDDRDRKPAENVELGYQMETALKQSEVDRQRNSLANNATYLPKMDNLEIEPNSEIIIPEPAKEAEKENLPSDNSTAAEVSSTDFALGRNSGDSKGTRRLNDDEQRAIQQARLSIYQALEQRSATIDSGGELYVRKVDNKKQDATITSKNSGQASSIVAMPNDNSILTESKNILTPGDVVIVQIDNYLNSDDNGKFVRMTMLEPIEGPIITGQYTRQGEYLNITTTTISYKSIIKPFKGIVVTADGRMSAGAVTSSDSHTLYRWSMLALSGALSGIGEVYLGSGGGTDKIIKENGDIYETSRPGYETIAIGVGKGIGDRTASIAEKEFNIPPTVILDPKEQAIWGVYVSDTTDLEGFPLIDRSKVY